MAAQDYRNRLNTTRMLFSGFIFGIWFLVLATTPIDHDFWSLTLS